MSPSIAFTISLNRWIADIGELHVAIVGFIWPWLDHSLVSQRKRIICLHVGFVEDDQMKMREKSLDQTEHLIRGSKFKSIRSNMISTRLESSADEKANPVLNFDWQIKRIWVEQRGRSPAFRFYLDNSKKENELEIVNSGHNDIVQKLIEENQSYLKKYERYW